MKIIYHSSTTFSSNVYLFTRRRHKYIRLWMILVDII